jgi:hypothetical protein
VPNVVLDIGREHIEPPSSRIDSCTPGGAQRMELTRSAMRCWSFDMHPLCPARDVGPLLLSGAYSAACGPANARLTDPSQRGSRPRQLRNLLQLSRRQQSGAWCRCPRSRRG